MNSRCLRAAAGSGTRSAATIDGRARVSAMVSAPGEACATRRGARRRRGLSLARATSSSSGKTGRASDGVGPAARHAPPAAQAGGGRGLPVPPTGGRGRGTARREAIRRARRSRLIRSSPGRQVELSSEGEGVGHHVGTRGGTIRMKRAGRLASSRRTAYLLRLRKFPGRPLASASAPASCGSLSSASRGRTSLRAYLGRARALCWHQGWRGVARPAHGPPRMRRACWTPRPAPRAASRGRRGTRGAPSRTRRARPSSTA